MSYNKKNHLNSTLRSVREKGKEMGLKNSFKKEQEEREGYKHKINDGRESGARQRSVHEVTEPGTNFHTGKTIGLRLPEIHVYGTPAF